MGRCPAVRCHRVGQSSPVVAVAQPARTAKFAGPDVAGLVCPHRLVFNSGKNRLASTPVVCPGAGNDVVECN